MSYLNTILNLTPKVFNMFQFPIQYISTNICLYCDVQLSDVAMTSIKVHRITIQAHENVCKSPNHLTLVASVVHHIYST
jgi:hypothetical protein